MDPRTLQASNEFLFQQQDAHNFRIQSFFSNDDTPWHHLAAIPPNVLGGPAELDYNALGPQFQIFQSHQTFSECDTLPQDSAYGSAPTIPESVPSLCDAELSRHYDQLPLDPARTQIDQLCGGIRDSFSNFPQNPPFAPREPVRIRAESKLHCPVCKIDLKTKAQLNKHNQRHGKPHLCLYQGCKRSNPGCGFGTQNDLLRHNRTVHREVDVNGPPFYVCIHEPCKSKKTPKRWPRADNFRSHLSRQHSDLINPDDDLSAYIAEPHLLLSSSPKSPLVPTPRSRFPEAHGSDLHGVGQGMGSLDVGLPQASLEGDHFLNADLPALDLASHDPELILRSDSGQISSYHEWPQSIGELVWGSQPNAANEAFPASFPDIADDFSNGSSDATSESLESPDPSHPPDDLLLEEVQYGEDLLDDLSRENRAWAAPDPVLEAKSLDNDGWSSEVSESDHATQGSSPDLTADDLEKSLREAQPHTFRIIKILQSLPPQLLKTALKRDQESEDEEAERDEDKPNVKDKARGQTLPKANHKCPECPKTFGRQCELKKHSKRHAKPYGCTFKECDKTFGSKNDWKRHESNQHSTLEMWTCDVPECHAVRHRQEIFRNHLLKDHHLTNQPKLVEEKLERCRMGRHCDPRFWCGFCVEVIEIKEASVNAWKRRCDHIDNHLWGKEGLTRKKMEDWIFVNDGKNRPGGGESGTVQTGLKRKAADTLERPLHKKQKEGSLMWYCCNCPNAGGAVLKLSSSCLECHHMKCPHCAQEMVTTED